MLLHGLRARDISGIFDGDVNEYVCDILMVAKIMYVCAYSSFLYTDCLIRALD